MPDPLPIDQLRRMASLPESQHFTLEAMPRLTLAPEDRKKYPGISIAVDAFNKALDDWRVRQNTKLRTVL